MSDDAGEPLKGGTGEDGRGFRRIRRFGINQPPKPLLPPPGLAETSARLIESMKRVDDFRPAPMPDLLSPAVRSADAAERTAQVIAEMHAATEAMVLLNQQTLKTAEQSLAASESARLDAARSEKFAKAMSWASVVIAGASLAAAVVAIAVSVSGS